MQMSQKQKKNQVEVSYNEWLTAFEKRQLDKRKPPDTFHAGEHPKYSGIGKKNTSFYPGCCNVIFDRKTIPKSGKSLINGCFIKDKGSYQLVYDIKSRALLGIDVNKIEQYKELLNEQYGYFERDKK